MRNGKTRYYLRLASVKPSLKNSQRNGRLTMRYNFKPAISPMKPCFSKGVRHILPKTKMYNGGGGVLLINNLRWRFSKTIMGLIWGIFSQDGIVYSSKKNGDTDKNTNGKIYRTPTPWHKYQYRPARKLLNLRLSKNLNKRISIEMTMMGEVFDLSDFDVDEQKFSYDNRPDDKKFGIVTKIGDAEFDITRSPELIRVFNSYPNNGKIGFDIKISDSFLNGWAAAQDRTDCVNPYSIHTQRKSYKEWDMGKEFSIERKALGGLDYEDTIKYLYKKINSVSWIHQSEES